MSKRRKHHRKHYNKARRSFVPSTTTRNVHHLLWIGKKWDSTHYGKLLRNHWYFKVSIQMNTIHKEIHRLMPNGIPIPSERELRHAWEVFKKFEENGLLSNDDTPMIRSLVLALLFEGKTNQALMEEHDIICEFYAHNPL